MGLIDRVSHHVYLPIFAFKTATKPFHESGRCSRNGPPFACERSTRRKLHRDNWDVIEHILYTGTVAPGDVNKMYQQKCNMFVNRDSAHEPFWEKHGETLHHFKPMRYPIKYQLMWRFRSFSSSSSQREETNNGQIRTVCPRVFLTYGTCLSTGT